MSDARRYAVWPDPRSRSRALESLNSFHFQNLSPSLILVKNPAESSALLRHLQWELASDH